MSEKRRVCYLTTIDNPYDPYDNWDDWYAYDESHGYSSCGLLARFSAASNEILLPSENLKAIEDAIDEIVTSPVNFQGIWMKLVKTVDPIHDRYEQNIGGGGSL